MNQQPLPNNKIYNQQRNTVLRNGIIKRKDEMYTAIDHLYKHHELTD